jgi:hypothetical protein
MESVNAYIFKEAKQKAGNLQDDLLRMAENKGLLPDDTKKLQIAMREKYVKSKGKMESELTL